MMANSYFIEYGGLIEKSEDGTLRRVIECDTSALEAVKIPETFARRIADALNKEQSTLGKGG